MKLLLFNFFALLLDSLPKNEMRLISEIIAAAREAKPEKNDIF